MSSMASGSQAQRLLYVFPAALDFPAQLGKVGGTKAYLRATNARFHSGATHESAMWLHRLPSDQTGRLVGCQLMHARQLTTERVIETEGTLGIRGTSTRTAFTGWTCMYGCLRISTQVSVPCPVPPPPARPSSPLGHPWFPRLCIVSCHGYDLPGIETIGLLAATLRSV